MRTCIKYVFNQQKNFAQINWLRPLDAGAHTHVFTVINVICKACAHIFIGVHCAGTTTIQKDYMPYTIEIRGSGAGHHYVMDTTNGRSFCTTWKDEAKAQYVAEALHLLDTLIATKRLNSLQDELGISTVEEPQNTPGGSSIPTTPV